MTNSATPATDDAACRAIWLHHAFQLFLLIGANLSKFWRGQAGLSLHTINVLHSTALRNGAGDGEMLLLRRKPCVFALNFHSWTKWYSFTIKHHSCSFHSFVLSFRFVYIFGDYRSVFTSWIPQIPSTAAPFGSCFHSIPVIIFPSSSVASLTSSSIC